MRLYDIVVVFKTNLSEAKKGKALETVKSWLKGAKFVKDESLGQKVLSFPIKHESAGLFHFFSIETEILPADFEKRLITSEDILRHLVIRKK